MPADWGSAWRARWGAGVGNRIFRGVPRGRNAYAELDSTSIQKRLFRYFGGVPTASSVYRLEDGSVTDVIPDDQSTIAHVWHGGHEHVLTDAEVLELSAAGFGDYIVEE